MAGAVHVSFTDLAALADQLGVAVGAELAGARAMEITRRYLRAFFDLHLRHREQPVLARSSPDHPEVTFCTPATVCR